VAFRSPAGTGVRELDSVTVNLSDETISAGSPAAAAPRSNPAAKVKKAAKGVRRRA
jgi:hypothetical protein